MVHLFDLQCVIAELTVAEVHHVKRMDPPTWARFLQILEDVVEGSTASWIVPVLDSPATQNVTTRAAMKSLLTANDPGVAAVVGGPLQALSRDQMRCHNCGELGHFARDCIQPRQQRGGSNVRDGLQALGVPDIQYQRHLLEELRDQVALQDQLVTVQEARAQEQARVGLTGGGVMGGAVAQMTAASGALRGPPPFRTPPLIVGGTQPWADASGAGYEHFGNTAQGLPIWAHSNIVEASLEGR